MLWVKSLIGILTVVSSLSLVSTEPLPCKVPVFRYALQHWQPDAYELVILHRGILTGDHDREASRLEQLAADKANSINVSVSKHDVEQNDPSQRLTRILGPEFQKQIIHPEMLLLYPADSQCGPVAWRGPLTPENVDALVDSPARKQIADWILEGESVVWVLIGCGDPQKDANAEQTLRSEIARLETAIVMRDIEVIESEKQYDPNTNVELRLGFELWVMDREDPKEQVFVSTLVNSEDDLDELGEPLAIPIFGRARSYLPLSGKGINSKMIESFSRILVGDCSCEIKRLNPGVDLLFGVNWNAIIGTAEIREPLPDWDGESEYVAIPPGTRGSDQDHSESDILSPPGEGAAEPEVTFDFDRSLLVGFAGFLVLVLLIVGIFIRRADD